MMHKILHLRNDIERLYVSRKEGGRGLVIIEDCVNASIQRLEDYIKKSQERLSTAASNSTDNKKTNNMIKNQEIEMEKNKFMDILSDHLVDSHTRKPGPSFKREERS